MIMIMRKNLYSARTIKYSKALNIKLQLKQFLKANNNNNNNKTFHAMRKSKLAKILYKSKIKMFKALNFRVILVDYKLS